jgi:phosphoglycolate phosphatase
MRASVAPPCDIYRAGVRDTGPAVGFDLDMTLIDSRPGIVDTLAALADESGEAALRAPDLLDALLKRNLDLELADRLPAGRARALADRFRELYADIGVPGSLELPGARDALTAVRARGMRAVVVTAKYEPNAWRCLRHVHLDVDAVHGWRLGPAKAEALVAERASVYVGDTPRDVEAARLAGATAVAVATGPHPADELMAAGAEVVLGSLEDFAGWWASSTPPG